MQIIQLQSGYAVHGDSTDPAVIAAVNALAGPFPLVIADPPYGNIVSNEWDKSDDEGSFVDWMVKWTNQFAGIMLPGAAFYAWGGLGRPRFRPFYRYLAVVEHETPFTLSTQITWAKKRAYGIQWGYLFTREELAYMVLGDVKKPRRFVVPLLDKKRGYAGYDENHPAKSEFLRRTNVWTDVTEILRGKVHVAEKPTKLYEIPIVCHTEPEEYVLDPFAGSGTCAIAAMNHGRRFVVVEKDLETFKGMLQRLRGHTGQQYLSFAR